MRPYLVVMLACAGMAAACGDDDDEATAGGARVPCEISALLEQHCARCHGATPREGAPLSLLRSSDFTAQRNGRSVARSAIARMRDPLRPMPPATEPKLPASDRDALSDWLERGAPADPDGCAVHTPAARDAGSTATGRDGGPVMRGEVERSDWPQFGGDLASTRANLRDHAISLDNVGTLARVWQLPTASTSCTPVAHDGIAYVPTWGAKLHAVAITDGAERWQVRLPALVDSSAAVSADRLFVSDARGSVHALARDDGELLWSQRVDEHPEVHLWSSPIHIPDVELVVVGVASYEEIVGKTELSFRGSLVALDARDGHERWRFYTTAANDEEGAGVAIWSTVAVDVERKVLYVGTGNNYQAPGSDLSDALLAIDYVSGERVWAHQFMADDVFSILDAAGPDYDIGAAANLFSAGGRDLVGVGIKSGLYAALDREDGTVVWTTQVSPGGLFGGIISASAYADGAIFVLSNDAASGEVAAAALDAENGKPIWQRRLPGQTFSGVAYSNGLVFTGTLDGTLSALDARSGEPLWSDRLPDAVASPIVADGTLLVTWGYPVSLGTDATVDEAGMSNDPAVGAGGVVAYAPAPSE
ncbi:MAG TPA: PQQ-binding-like beta-propeller repeat protein [Polyangiales bacterium]|nr:PQQ-binding-like beta-propeller repeat protein [Polyangiales bacterium]